MTVYVTHIVSKSLIAFKSMPKVNELKLDFINII